MLKNTWQGEPAWQVRGMAVSPPLQRSGVGGLMLMDLQRLAAEHADGVRLMWCNARSSAVGFYERHGWVVASEAFVIESAGPHFRMTRRL
jgi:GNAT superfamily N-acetyltransferase